MVIKGLRQVWAGRSTFVGRIKSERGAAATEYGLMLVLIALAIVAGATALGIAINAVFEDSAGELGGVGGGEGGDGE